jgi:hypothetical protein
VSTPARRRHPERTYAPIPAGHCRVTGKLRWEARGHARRQLRDLKSRGDKRAAALGTYHCHGCHAWHVGHRGAA